MKTHRLQKLYQGIGDYVEGIGNGCGDRGDYGPAAARGGRSKPKKPRGTGLALEGQGWDRGRSESSDGHGVESSRCARTGRYPSAGEARWRFYDPLARSGLAPTSRLHGCRGEARLVDANGQPSWSLACGIGSVQRACSRASVPKNRQAGALHVFSPSGIVMHVLY